MSAQTGITDRAFRATACVHGHTGDDCVEIKRELNLDADAVITDALDAAAKWWSSLSSVEIDGAWIEIGSAS